MKTATELWSYVSKKGLKPLPKTTVSRWADDYRMLSAGISAEPGRWRTSRAPYQKDIMDAFTQSGVDRVIVKSCSQIGKALDVNTPIPTPTGWSTMGELQTGDAVFDETGKICHVTACTDIMLDRPCYRVTFSDGASLIADENHKWRVQLDKKRKGKIIEKVLTTGEMLPIYKSGNRNNYAIPVANPLRTEAKELPIDPYTLGVWLGDGNTMSAQLTLCDSDLFIANRIREAGHEVAVRRVQNSHHVMNVQIDLYHPEYPICRRGHDKRITGYTKHGYCAECARQVALRNKWKGIKDIKVDPIVNEQNTFRHQLVQTGVLGNKHIPEQYLRASAEQRWALLQGLLDTDGYVSKKSICEITQKSERLAGNISELLYTLGIKHVMRKKKAVCTNSPTKAKSIVWRITFTAYDDMPVFTLPRKRERLQPRSGRRTTETTRRRIVCIEPVEGRPVKCIAVDSPSHLYLAGRAMIPTHNSDILNNVIGRFAHLDPCGIMLIQPTIDMAQDYSKSRIAPMIRDTKVLSSLFFDIKSRDSGNTILSKLFPGGRLIMCGANSPAGLASRPIRVLLADEVDRFPLSAGTEGDPVDLAAKRTTTFWNRVIGMFSTPTIEGSSRIDDEYIVGTQEEWQHACPNCGEYHLLRHNDMNVDFDEEKKANGKKVVYIKSIVWRCPDCGHSFTEEEMRKAKQKYVARNPKALENGVRSFFVNCFASPWISWQTVMKEWLQAKGNPEREKVVTNTRFGESYAPPGAFDDPYQFLNRREEYGAELPAGVLMLTAAVDTQDNRLEYEVCGWGKEEEAWGIRKGVILGVPDREETWQQLDAVLDHEYRFKDGKRMKITRTFIDSGGHYTGCVYQYCLKNINKQRFAIKGDGGPGIPLNEKIGKPRGVIKIPLVYLGVDDGKQQVMNRLAIEEPGPMYFHFPKDKLDDQQRGYDELYFKGLISEQKVMTIRNGRLRESWKPIKSHIRNEPLDLRVYNLACMQSIPKNWDYLASLLEGKGDSWREQNAPTESIKERATYKRKASRRQNIW